MILKNLTRRNNPGQLVEYIFKDHNKGKKIEPLVKHNLRGKNIKEWTREFKDNFENRLHKRKDNVMLNHVILSLNAKDRDLVKTDMLKDFVNHFIELRGKDSMFLANIHLDKEHAHVHVVYSASKLSGESNRLSKLEFKELKIQLQEFQKSHYPELKNSLPDHDKGLSKRQEVLNQLESIYAKSTSLSHFLEELKSNGLRPYYRSNEIYGVESEDRKFRFNTLGFDKEILELLDNPDRDIEQQQIENEPKTLEEIELDELAELRESKSQEREIEAEQEEDLER